ncbi:glycosyltransferase family 2 protein [Sinimarinibacterium thermocellulolyticum]|uniref:Glycosyltransferase family 2 protein n=1 Tax=Sinimarinibacterium thermocellulolyticum TaxID=3170016 RepID=A0ABV2AAL7_9GAMM
MSPPSFAVVVPTLNAGDAWLQWWQALQRQTLQPTRVLIVDSESTDATPAIALAHGAQVVTVSRADFDHGGTRAQAALLVDEPILVYMTQDAILHGDDSLARLLAVFEWQRLGAAYGRQLPRPQAGPIERHHRLFSYPPQSRVVTPAEAPRWGIRAPFLSDSYAAYRRSALLAVGNFPARAIVSEDMYVGGRMLQGGWSLAYVAEAAVIHSHAYNLVGDVRRYFDIGAFYSEQDWLLREFGGGGGEGWRFARSELAYLLRRAPWRIPEALLRSACKLAAFHLGRRQQRLPAPVRLRLSGQKHYFRRPQMLPGQRL